MSNSTTVRDVESRFEGNGWRRESVGRDAVIYVRPVPGLFVSEGKNRPSPPSVLETILIGAVSVLTAAFFVSTAAKLAERFLKRKRGEKGTAE